MLIKEKEKLSKELGQTEKEENLSVPVMKKRESSNTINSSNNNGQKVNSTVVTNQSDSIDIESNSLEKKTRYSVKFEAPTNPKLQAVYGCILKRFLSPSIVVNDNNSKYNLRIFLSEYFITRELRENVFKDAARDSQGAKYAVLFHTTYSLGESEIKFVKDDVSSNNAYFSHVYMSDGSSDLDTAESDKLIAFVKTLIP